MHPRETNTLRLSSGQVIGYAEYGARDGVPVLAQHGTPGSRFMFRRADADARRTGLRFIAPERPGYGLSSPVRDHSLAKWALAMAEFSDRLGLERPIVFGVSGGSGYACAMAAREPGRVRALALVSPLGPVGAADIKEKLNLGQKVVFNHAAKIPALYPIIFRVGRSGFLYTPAVIYSMIVARAGAADWPILKKREVRRDLISAVQEGMRRGVAGGLEEMQVFSRPWEVDLGAITAPTVIWQGLADRIVPIPAALYLADAIPNARLITLPEAGHYWVFDHVPEIVDTVAAMVREPVAA